MRRRLLQLQVLVHPQVLLVVLGVPVVWRWVLPLFDAPLFDAPVDESAQVDIAVSENTTLDYGLVLVRTLQEGVVQGMRLPAGVTVETSEADAASLVESGIGIIIQRADVRPDEEVTRTQKS